MNVILLSLPRTDTPLTKLRPGPRLVWDARFAGFAAFSGCQGVRPKAMAALNSPSKPLLWPHLQSELGALSSTKHGHSCILGTFLPPSSRYGLQASEVTKPEPQATAQGGCVTATNQPPSLRETHNGSCPPNPPLGDSAKPLP